MNKRTMEKGLAIVLALVMVFAMTATAFATDLDPNLTMVDFSQARTSYQQSGLQSAQTLVLKATTANTGWSATEFSTEAAAKAVSWTSSNNAMATIIDTERDIEAVSAPNGGYYSQAKVTIPANAPVGSCTIKAQKDNAYVNFTVVIEGDAANPSVASNVNVYVIDIRTGSSSTGIESYKFGLTASMPANNSIYSGYTDRATSFSTPAYALEAMVKPSGSYNSDEGYVDYITGISLYSYGVYIYTITSDVFDAANGVLYTNRTATGEGYYGWNYRVVRNGQLKEDSKYIGAADYQLESDDEVYWLYGTEAMADAYIEGILS